MTIVARQLGHAGPATTLGVYAHLFDQMQRAATARPALEESYQAMTGTQPLSRRPRLQPLRPPPRPRRRVVVVVVEVVVVGGQAPEGSREEGVPEDQVLRQGLRDGPAGRQHARRLPRQGERQVTASFNAVS